MKPPTAPSPASPAKPAAGGLTLHRLLLLSLLAHLLVLAGIPLVWRAPPPIKNETPQRLQIRFERPAAKVFAARVVIAPGPRPPPTSPTIGPERRAVRATSAPSTAPSPSVGVSRFQHAAGMLEQTSADIRAKARREWLDPMSAPHTPRHETPGAIEIATARPQQGVEQLSERLVRVTLADGRRYCLQDLPEIAKSAGPTTPLTVPMNCP